jgi:hypothetical protein
MTALSAYVDATSAAIEWINSQTATLVGAGKPIQNGAMRRRLRSPGEGAYVFVDLISTTEEPTEAPIHQARIQCSVYAGTEPAAAQAAVALGNAMRDVDGRPVSLTGITLWLIADLSGPLFSPDGDEQRYLLDAVFHFSPST